MSSEQIIEDVKNLINSEVDTDTKRKGLILLQAQATLDSTETAWSVSLMMEPFIMELREKNH